MIKKIVSGGQTGADQAGLDAAIDYGIGYGGYIPRGRKTERGPLSSKYKSMTELETPDYRVRTLLNVSDSDGTVVFTYGNPNGGSALTLRSSISKGKPTLHVDLNKVSKESGVELVRNWVQEHGINVLNVAGSRKSHAPNIHSAVYSILMGVLEWELINEC